MDYYIYIVFELMMDNFNYDGVIIMFCGGGCYNGLLELLDGLSEIGIGFVLSIEWLLFVFEEEGIELDIEENLDLFIVIMGD